MFFCKIKEKKKEKEGTKDRKEDNKKSGAISANACACLNEIQMNSQLTDITDIVYCKKWS